MIKNLQESGEFDEDDSQLDDDSDFDGWNCYDRVRLSTVDATSLNSEFCRSICIMSCAVNSSSFRDITVSSIWLNLIGLLTLYVQVWSRLQKCSNFETLLSLVKSSPFHDLQFPSLLHDSSAGSCLFFLIDGLKFELYLKHQLRLHTHAHTLYFVYFGLMKSRICASVDPYKYRWLMHQNCYCCTVIPLNI